MSDKSVEKVPTRRALVQVSFEVDIYNDPDWENDVDIYLRSALEQSSKDRNPKILSAEVSFEEKFIIKP